MRYSLDANAISRLLQKDPQALEGFSQACRQCEVVICPMAAYEVWRWLFSRKATRQLEDLEELMSRCLWHDFTREIWRSAAQHWAELREKGVGLDKRDADLLIASHARHLGATVITEDRDFNQLPCEWVRWADLGEH
ncbi:MAG: PIN domain-containing protein [Thermoanaerobaculia bacterium]